MKIYRLIGWVFNKPILQEYKMFSEKAIQNFLKKIDKSNDCWLWTAYTSLDGYGCYTVPPKRYLAHRFSYLYFKGAIPDGSVVMHTCDNPPCVNPNHLKLGTQKENIQDSVAKGRFTKSKPPRKHVARFRDSPRKKLLCVRGHDTSKPENIYSYPSHNGGGHVCRICKADERRASVRRFRERQKLKRKEESNGKSN